MKSPVQPGSLSRIRMRLGLGSTGAGKTTAIGVVSEIPPLSTDVRNTGLGISKEMTTVGLDYGELKLDGGDKLCLSGTPGQKRYGLDHPD